MARRQTNELMTEQEAAEFLGVPTVALSSWRKKGLVPAKQIPGQRGVYYERETLQQIKQIAQKLAKLGVPSSVSAVVHKRIPVRWMTQLLGISRQRIYQLVPGNLTVENALSLLERRVKTNPELSKIYRALKELHQSGQL
ncbi:MAG: MerR family transcriptional regulator [Armatimonadetes bacterium]|nr:MerR family transcriptional regulator [Armatimonadota bacterium]MCX7966981.1 MerR family transcriptional regulator [Armatimonadota bacterium]MDW8142138.1 MerR family transcriptional regulator [Armatimonadota bacterium]